MSLLQNMIYTLGYQLESLKDPYKELVVTHGLPSTAPTELTIAVEHEDTASDQQYELAGYRKRTHVFVADIYALDKGQRCDLIEAVKNLLEDKNLPVVDIAKQDTGHIMTCEGITGKVNLEQPLQARMNIHFSILIN